VLVLAGAAGKTRKALSELRLHLGQEGSQARVGMPRGLFPVGKGGSYCLRVWDHFPSKGEPYASVCSGNG
jgi:hypothetical protein